MVIVSNCKKNLDIDDYSIPNVSSHQILLEKQCLVKSP